MARTRQQKEMIALVALLLIAGSIWYYFHLGRSTKATTGFSASHYSPINALDYIVIINGLAKAQGTEYKSAGRNIFVMGAMPVDVTKQDRPKKVFVVYNQPQPEVIPPAVLPMVFFGYGMLPAGGARQAFLKEDPPGDEVHIVSEGDVVLNHIRILHIGNDKIDFEDTITKQRGSKNLEAAPAA